nr:MAG TPA: hypothetical protein [Caudoviricetes sp.]
MCQFVSLFPAGWFAKVCLLLVLTVLHWLY